MSRKWRFLKKPRLYKARKRRWIDVWLLVIAEPVPKAREPLLCRLFNKDYKETTSRYITEAGGAGFTREILFAYKRVPGARAVERFLLKCALKAL